MATLHIPEPVSKAPAGYRLCSRCNGTKGWTGWPGFTCYLCRGTGVRPLVSTEPKPERRRMCVECHSSHKPSEDHWNGLLHKECLQCKAVATEDFQRTIHGREACPRCGAPHPDLKAVPA